jgi:hypothetical protein
MAAGLNDAEQARTEASATRNAVVAAIFGLASPSAETHDIGARMKHPK